MPACLNQVKEPHLRGCSGAILERAKLLLADARLEMWSHESGMEVQIISTYQSGIVGIFPLALTWVLYSKMGV